MSKTCRISFSLTLALLLGALTAAAQTNGRLFVGGCDKQGSVFAKDSANDRAHAPGA